MRFMPTSMTTAPGLTQSRARPSRGAPDRGDEHVGAAADARRGRACASGRRHRRVGREQQLRHRLAEEVRAPDHDGLGALERRRPAPRAGSCTPERRARAQPLRGPSASRPALRGVRPSTSFPGRSAPVSATPSMWSGTGSWHEDAARRASSALSSLDQGGDLVLAARRPRACGRSRSMPTSGARLLLAADVDGARPGRRPRAPSRGRARGRSGGERRDLARPPRRARAAATALPSMIRAAMRARGTLTACVIGAYSAMSLRSEPSPAKRTTTMPPGSTAGHDALAEGGVDDVVADAEARRLRRLRPARSAHDGVSRGAPAAGAPRREAAPDAGRCRRAVGSTRSRRDLGQEAARAARSSPRRRRCGAARR